MTDQTKETQWTSQYIARLKERGVPEEEARQLAIAAYTEHGDEDATEVADRVK